MAKAMYDVAISFAGAQRDYARQLAKGLQNNGVKVFFDEFEKAELWGKDLQAHFSRIFQTEARYCIILVSADYARRAWPVAEHKAAQARALNEHGGEYVLPIRFDDVEIPGLLPTIAYLDARVDPLETVIDSALSKIGKVNAKPKGPSESVSERLPAVTQPSMRRPCPQGPHFVRAGPYTEIQLDVRDGELVTGRLREVEGRKFWFGILDEENVVEFENDRYCNWETAATDDLAAHYVKWKVPAGGPWFLIMFLASSSAAPRNVLVDLRSEPRNRERSS